MKLNLFLRSISFLCVLLTFGFLIFYYDLYLNDKKIVSCEDLDYESALLLSPKNFTSMRISLDFLDNRKWKEITLNNHASFVKKGYFLNNQSAKAVVTFELNRNFKCMLKAKVKPHGDLEDHHMPVTELPSMQVYLEDGNIYGIVKFLLLRPKTRVSLDDEITASFLTNEMGFLSPRTARIIVNNNDKVTKFIFQEKVVKELIEFNSYREGLLFSNDDRLHYSEENDPFDVNYFKISNSKIVEKSKRYIDSFKVLNTLNKERKYIENLNIKSDYNNFFNNKFLAFDVLLLALNAEHASYNDNRRIYYDFMNREFLPIYYDGMARLYPFKIEDVLINDSIRRGALINLKLFKSLSKNALVDKLKNLGVSKSRQEVFQVLNLLEERLNFLSSDENNQKYQYQNKDILEKKYNNENFYKAILLNLRELLVCGHDEVKCHTLKISEPDLKSLLSQRYKFNDLPVILVNKFRKQKKAEFYENELNKRKHVKLVFDKFNLLLYGDINYNYNKKFNKLSLVKNSLNARALINNQSVLDNLKIEFYDKSTVKNKLDPSKYLISEEGLTGCLTIYDSILNNVEFFANNSNCEDAINIVKSKGNILRVVIENSKSDALDVDFSNLQMKNFNIQNAKNDCIDFSGGTYYLEKLYLNNCSDKGLSAENSNITVKNITVLNSLYGIASKDSSLVKLKNIKIDKVEICWDAYNKKQEFGGGYIYIEKLKNNFCSLEKDMKPHSKFEVN